MVNNKICVKFLVNQLNKESKLAKGEGCTYDWTRTLSTSVFLPGYENTTLSNVIPPLKDVGLMPVHAEASIAEDRSITSNSRYAADRAAAANTVHQKRFTVSGQQMYAGDCATMRKSVACSLLGVSKKCWISRYVLDNEYILLAIGDAFKIIRLKFDQSEKSD